MIIVSGYPREFGTTRIQVNSEQELIKLINFNNGYSKCFVSLFSFYDNDKQVPKIDVAFYDFDKNKSQVDAIKLQEYLEQQGFKHIISFSGDGIHIYIKTELSTEKDLLYDFQMSLITKLNIKPDTTTVGDVRRMRRIMGTWNVKQKRYCVPITKEQLRLSWDNLCQVASKQNFNYTVYGTKLVNLEDYKGFKPVVKDRKYVEFNSKYALPPCSYIIANINGRPGHTKKLVLVADLIWAITMGQKTDEEKLTNEITDFIFKNCKWTDLTNYNKTRYHVKYAISKFTFGYSCESKQKMDICVGANCPQYREQIVKDKEVPR